MIEKHCKLSGILLAFLTIIVLDHAQATPGFGHATDSDRCLGREQADKSADERIRACWKALNSRRLTRNGIAFALNNLAAAYIAKQDWESALNALNAAIKLEGDTWQALVNRGQVYARSGKLDLANQDFNRAIEIDSSQPIAFRARGEFYLDERKFDFAVADFTRALALNSKDAKALLYRAITKERMGNAAGAAVDLAHAKEIEPSIIGKLDKPTTSKSTIHSGRYPLE